MENILSLRRESNDPPTPEESIRLRSFISAREKIRDLMKQELTDQDALLLKGEGAITKLKAATDQAYRAHQGYTYILETLGSAPMSNVASPERLEELEANDSSAWKALIDQSTNRDLEVALEQRKKAQDHFRDLQAELDGWVFTRDLAQTTINDLSIMITVLQAEINAANTAFASIRKVPPEIWRTILQTCIEYEALDHLEIRPDADFLQSPGGTYQRRRYFSPFTLAHVCRIWREIILHEPFPWRTFGIEPNAHWLERNHPLFVQAMRHPTLPLHFVFNLTRYRRSSQRLPFPLRVDPPVPYDLHLVMATDDTETILTASKVVLSNPTKLVISLSASHPGSELFKIFHNFPNLKSLEIIDQGYHVDKIGRFNEMLPQLTSLVFEFNELPLLNFRDLLSTNLTELKILHRIGGDPTIESVYKVQLRSLTHLAVTYPSAGIIRSLYMPALRTLSLHGTERFTTTVSSYDEDIEKILRRVDRLAFVDWYEPCFSDFGRVVPFKACEIAANELSDTEPHSMRCLDFVSSYITGAALIELVQRSTADGSPIFPNLKEMMIDRCTGIKKEECEMLQVLLSKLRVYI
ncbi:hypothetical protein CPB86DRAFT_817213 [Serendipita vermifera]|nr:hypothetical protein CPB86DRAFT_817213 [Serendipita vermifera]